MNPTDQPPSTEAVKAAFAICEYDRNNRDTWESFDVAEEFLLKSGLRRKHESPSECAARILAAHARAKEAEVARLREALGQARHYLGPHAIRSVGQCCQCGGTTPNGTLKICFKCVTGNIDKALTGEASA